MVDLPGSGNDQVARTAHRADDMTKDGRGHDTLLYVF